MMFVKKEKKLQIVLSDLRIEAQRIAWLETKKELDASRAEVAKSEKISLDNGWCEMCSCNHPIGQHHDRESYL